MARSNDIQYVRYYTFGSAAEKIELPQRKKILPKPKQAAEQLPVVRLDGLCVIGLVLAAVMLVCMLFGFVQVRNTNAELEELKLYVSQLEIQNAELQAQYDHGFDIEEVKIAAQSMGLVPVDEVRHITVSVPETTGEAELSWWQEFMAGIRDFFA